MQGQKLRLGIATGIVALLGLHASTTQAHTIAVGTLNAGAPGSVTVWMGSYHNSAPLEGSMTLGGVTKNFNTYVSTLPSGLVAGSNYFYASNTSTVGEYNSATNTTGLTEISWQSVTFSGLTAGVHTYMINGMNTVNWADWNSSQANWTGSLKIGAAAVGSVPVAGSALLMMLGAAGLRSRARKRLIA